MWKNACRRNAGAKAHKMRLAVKVNPSQAWPNKSKANTVEVVKLAVNSQCGVSTMLARAVGL